ncbi:MAG: LCP family protein [Firmicutes bacterium]|nr:LCP family protein [Bacillota bacterium]
MPRQQPYDLEFQPKERRRRDQMLRFLGGFGVIVLLLGVISVIAVQRDGLLDDFLSALRPTESTTEPPEWTYSGSGLFLLCETDDTGQDLRFCALVRADVTQRQVHVFPLSPRAMAPHEGGERSLEQALRAGGPKELKAAAEALIEGTVDRYIAGGDKGFVTAVNLMGSVTVQVEKSIRYRGAAFTLTLAEGSQRLQGDMLLRYFRYLGTLEEGGTLAQGELLARVLETYLTKPAGIELLESRFNSLMNILRTDISVSDFYTRRELLLALLENGGKLTVDVKE